MCPPARNLFDTYEAGPCRRLSYPSLLVDPSDLTVSSRNCCFGIAVVLLGTTLLGLSLHVKHRKLLEKLHVIHLNSDAIGKGRLDACFFKTAFGCKGPLGAVRLESVATTSRFAHQFA